MVKHDRKFLQQDDKADVKRNSSQIKGGTRCRIYLYFEEVNREPVVYHWTYKMDEISQDEAVKAGIKSNAN